MYAFGREIGREKRASQGASSKGFEAAARGMVLNSRSLATQVFRFSFLLSPSFKSCLAKAAVGYVQREECILP